MTRRRRAHTYGRSAEWVAAAWLMFKGYRLLARRVRTGAGEIDLVLRHKETIAYVEVKARKTLIDAHHALTPRSLTRMRRAARIMQARFDPTGRLNHRFDAVLIAPFRFPSHIMEVIEA